MAPFGGSEVERDDTSYAGSDFETRCGWRWRRLGLTPQSSHCFMGFAVCNLFSNHGPFSFDTGIPYFCSDILARVVAPSTPNAELNWAWTGKGPSCIAGGDFSSASLNQSSSLSPLVTRLGAPNQLSLLLGFTGGKSRESPRIRPGVSGGSRSWEVRILGRPRSREPADYPQFMNWLFSRRKTGPR